MTRTCSIGAPDLCSPRCPFWSEVERICTLERDGTTVDVTVKGFLDDVRVVGQLFERTPRLRYVPQP